MPRLQEASLARATRDQEMMALKASAYRELILWRVLPVVQTSLEANWGPQFQESSTEFTYHGPDKATLVTRVIGYDAEGQKTASFGYHVDGERHTFVISGQEEVYSGQIPEDRSEKERVIKEASDKALQNPWRHPETTGPSED